MPRINMFMTPSAATSPMFAGRNAHVHLPQRPRPGSGRGQFTAPIADCEYHGGGHCGERERRPGHVSVHWGNFAQEAHRKQHRERQCSRTDKDGQEVAERPMARRSCRPGMSDTQHRCASHHVGDEHDQGRHLLLAGHSG